MLNLGQSLDQLNIIQMNLDLKAKLTGKQVITAVSHDVKSPKSKSLPGDSLTKSEREALPNLQ